MESRTGELAKLLLLAFLLWLAWRFFSAVAWVLLVAGLVLVLAMVFSPVVSWFERRHLPRGVGALVLAVLLLTVAGAIALWLIPPLLQQTSVFIAAFPTYWHRLLAWATRFTARYPDVQRFFTPAQALPAEVGRAAEAALATLPGLVRRVLVDLGGVVLVFVMTLFVLADPRRLLVGLFAAVPQPWRGPVANALHVTAQQMRVWAWSSSLIGSIEALTVWVGLSLLGVQPALLLAALVFFGEFLPYIGPIAAALPALLVALAVGPFTGLWTLLLYLFIHVVESSLLIPFITSRQMEFHPLAVAFAIIMLGEVYGIIGAVLAVPLLATLKAFYLELYVRRRLLSQEELERYADVVLEAHRPGSELHRS